MSVYRSVVEFNLDPSRLDEGIPALKAVLQQTRDFEGCMELDLVQDDNQPGHLVAVIGWESGEAQRLYSNWRAEVKTDESVTLGGYLVAPSNKYFGSVL